MHLDPGRPTKPEHCLNQSAFALAHRASRLTLELYSPRYQSFTMSDSDTSMTDSHAGSQGMVDAPGQSKRSEEWKIEENRQAIEDQSKQLDEARDQGKENGDGVLEIIKSLLALARAE
ncbi:hypothetical protein P8C59_004916 [Phyllachora maydis]|uniref:Uncharacterized protein n=1 Tax=Phyllachora maydis TaxID=1825666 RepID=A0AAD9MEY1_9PEZI|nr:hypothetical protein P8C59_004916 [Phyllachora maydis]